MQKTIFSTKITSSKLKENIARQFGVGVNLEKYNREQLEDMRNKLRTRIFQHEGTSKFNELLKKESYQKDKAMLELLNTRIKEMLGEQMQKLRDRMDQLSEAKKGTRPPKTKITAKGSKPDFLDMDKDGDKKEPMKKAVADKKDGPKKGVNPFAKVKEGFPTVDDAKKAAAGTGGMKTGDSKKSSTGGTITKTATGLKHTAGKNYGGEDAPKTPDSDKKLKKVKEAEEKCSECDMYENKCSCVKEGADSKTDKSKLPSMAHIKKMCQDGKSVAEICKMHPNCNQKELKQMVADCKKKMIKESQFKHNVRFVNESLAFLINEDEEGKAKAITAAGDMVNDYTSWMQRVGQYQTKTMIELADAIKADFGAQEAEAFKSAVGPALSQTLEVLTQQREAVSNAVAVLAGEAAPEAPMGMEPELPPESGMDAAAPDMMNPEPAGDEFGAADAAAGGPEAAGRAMRESKEQRRARKLAESHSIISKLAR
jgi:hypothetical protein